MLPYLRFTEARQPLEIVRYKIKRMLEARRRCSFSAKQQARYSDLLRIEKRLLDALRHSVIRPTGDFHQLDKRTVHP
jgi:hypothetical protein